MSGEKKLGQTGSAILMFIGYKKQTCRTLHTGCTCPNKHGIQETTYKSCLMLMDKKQGVQ